MGAAGIVHNGHLQTEAALRLQAWLLITQLLIFNWDVGKRTYYVNEKSIFFSLPKKFHASLILIQINLLNQIKCNSAVAEISEQVLAPEWFVMIIPELVWTLQIASVEKVYIKHHNNNQNF